MSMLGRGSAAGLLGAAVAFGWFAVDDADACFFAYRREGKTKEVDRPTPAPPPETCARGAQRIERPVAGPPPAEGCARRAERPTAGPPPAERRHGAYRNGRKIEEYEVEYENGKKEVEIEYKDGEEVEREYRTRDAKPRSDRGGARDRNGVRLERRFLFN